MVLTATHQLPMAAQHAGRAQTAVRDVCLWLLSLRPPPALAQVNYFYRLSDLVGEHAFEGKGQGARNRKTMCQALVRLGIVETITAAEELISKRNTGTSRASRLLNKFVSNCLGLSLFPVNMSAIHHGGPRQ
jgi:hypothetical protein